MHGQWWDQKIESIDETLQMLLSKLWDGQDENLTGDLEIQGEVGSSVNVFCIVDVLAGPSKVYIRALVATVVLVIEEYVHKLCSIRASIIQVRILPRSSGRLLLAAKSTLHPLQQPSFRPGQHLQKWLPLKILSKPLHSSNSSLTLV